MLFELSGLATVINVQPVSQGFTKVQLLGTEHRKTTSGFINLSGARWVNLNGALADYWAANVEKFKGAIVHILATGSTDKNGDSYYENYRVENISVAAWKEHAKHMNTKIMLLSGMGRVISINKKNDFYTSLKVISSRKFGEKEVTVTRFIDLSGKAAQYWAANADKLLKQRILFKAEVTSSKVGEGDNAKYYDNYTMFDFPTVIYPTAAGQQQQNSGSEQQAPNQYDQQMPSYMEPNNGFDDFGFPMEDDMGNNYDAYEQYADSQQFANGQ